VVVEPMAARDHAQSAVVPIDVHQRTPDRGRSVPALGIFWESMRFNMMHV
jgi:hypothetical protein